MSHARFIDVHILHALPYSNLNRDDLGSPKTLQYGGVTRSRVSSQCYKRATRVLLEDRLADNGGVDRTTRTRRAAGILTDVLTGRGWNRALAEFAARDVFRKFEKTDKKAADGNGAVSEESNVLLFLAESQYAELADLAEQHKDALAASVPAEGAKPAKREKKIDGVIPLDAVTTIIAKCRGTIALFGRMIADLPDTNIDAGVQVAHAFTTHATTAEFDYFTAVDDIVTGITESGSAHLGSRQFTSGVFYRYATVDLDDLARNTAGDRDVAARLVQYFLRAFIDALPTGASNITAAHTAPNLVALTVRSDRPLSYASAFEKPVRAAGDGHLLPSAAALDEHAAIVGGLYEDGQVFSGYVTTIPERDATVSAFGEKCTSFRQLVDGALAATNLAPAGV